MVCCVLQAEIILQHTFQDQKDWKSHKEEEEEDGKYEFQQSKTATPASSVHQVNPKQSTSFSLLSGNYLAGEWLDDVTSVICCLNVWFLLNPRKTAIRALANWDSNKLINKATVHWHSTQENKIRQVTRGNKNNKEKHHSCFV